MLRQYGWQVMPPDSVCPSLDNCLDLRLSSSLSLRHTLAPLIPPFRAQRTNEALPIRQRSQLFWNAATTGHPAAALRAALKPRGNAVGEDTALSKASPISVNFGRICCRPSRSSDLDHIVQLPGLVEKCRACAVKPQRHQEIATTHSLNPVRCRAVGRPLRREP